LYECHLEDHDRAPRDGYTEHLPEGPFTVRDVSDAEGYGDNVEGIVTEGKLQGVGLHEGDTPVKSLLFDLCFAEVKHLEDEINAGGADAAVFLRGIYGKVRGSAGDIEEPPRLEKAHLLHRKAAPCDITAQTQEVVEKVIFPGDRGEHLLHHADAFFL
jgi:hypothetical protein